MRRGRTAGLLADLAAVWAAAAALWTAAAVVCAAAPAEGTAARTHQAWAVGRANGQAAITEIWAANGDGEAKRLGAFPGPPGRLGWQGGRLYYLDRPVAVAALGVGVSGRETALTQEAVWLLPLTGGDLRLAAPDEVGGVVWQADGHANPGSPGGPAGGEPDVSGALRAVGAAVNAAADAYGALCRWDFRLARNRYRQAARQFVAIAEGPGNAGLYREPVLGYARTLAAQAELAGTQGARWACREHLGAIGVLLGRYTLAAGHMPADLAELKAWAAAGPPAADAQALDRVFRSAIDPLADRDISYLYRPAAEDGEAVVISPFHEGRLVELVKAGPSYRVIDRAVHEAQVDSMLAAGTALLDSSAAAALPLLEAVTTVAPGLAMGHARLGYALLGTGQPDRALKAFERAVTLNDRLALAYNGLGLVYRDRPKSLYVAIHYFQEALQHDRDYTDARFNMARIRYELEEFDVKHDLDRILATDPDYAPAHLLMGEFYENLQEDAEQAVVHYARYMSLRPEDPAGRRRLASAYLSGRNYDRIVDLLTDYVRTHPAETDVLAILAQACVEQGRLAWASRYFSEYLAAQPEAERAYYQDPSLLMSDEERATYDGSSGAEREALLRRFWRDRDPNLTTAENERQLEHYRRVWHARQNFSGGKEPWDRRGEVYIRFGEPDHRTRSDMKNMAESLRVQQVRERMARQIYGHTVDRLSFHGGPVYAVRSLRSSLANTPGVADGYGRNARRAIGRIAFAGETTLEGESAGEGFAGLTGEQTREGPSITDGTDIGGAADVNIIERQGTETIMMEGIGPLGDGTGGGSNIYYDFRPVTVQEDASMVPWEAWVYTDVGNGIEITFTDERLNGVFDYAPPPMDPALPVVMQGRFLEFNPRRVVELASLVTPDYYVSPDNRSPVQFYYDVAHFRGGEDGRTRVEVYLGVPHRYGRYDTEADRTDMRIERTVGLLNEETGAVYRRRGELQFQASGNVTGSAGGFVPELVTLGVPPGTYRMEIELLDRHTGRQGRYRQMVTVDDYVPEGLKLSELELAWRVSEHGAPGKFSKGELDVIPLPSRTIGLGQGIFVYYEIYNLARDDFGRNRYKVEYKVSPSRGAMSRGIITQLVKAFSSESQEVAVGYEQSGLTDRERAYTELDLSGAVAGKHVLEVTVTDLLSGQTQSRKATFVVAQ